MGIEKVIPSELELVNIFGVNDNNLKYIKSIYPLLNINVRGNIIFIEGDKKEATEVLRILDEMVEMSSNKEVIDEADVELLSKINTSIKRNGKKISSVNIIDNKFFLIRLLREINSSINSTTASSISLTELPDAVVAPRIIVIL